MYVVAFSFAYLMIRLQARRGDIDLDADQSLNLVLYCVVGLVVGARLFSVLFYDGTTYYWTHPWMIFWPFRDGRFVGLPGIATMEAVGNSRNWFSAENTVSFSLSCRR